MAEHLAAPDADLVCAVFGKLDWGKIDAHRDSTTLVSFLHLYLCAVAVRRESVNHSAREAAARRNWGGIAEDDLARTFDGNAFVRLLKCTPPPLFVLFFICFFPSFFFLFSSHFPLTHKKINK
jgi:hypothetical protein